MNNSDDFNDLPHKYKFIIRLTPLQNEWLRAKVVGTQKCSESVLRNKKLKFLDDLYLFALANCEKVAARIEQVSHCLSSEGIDLISIYKSAEPKNKEEHRLTVTMRESQLRVLSCAAASSIKGYRASQCLALTAILNFAILQHQWVDAQMNAQKAYASAEGLSAKDFWIGQCKAYRPKRPHFTFLFQAGK